MFSFFRRIFRRRETVAVESTAFSDFFRNASSREKKKVYEAALKRASEAQNKVVERHRACA
jgi:hypothetical protein